MKAFTSKLCCSTRYCTWAVSPFAMERESSLHIGAGISFGMAIIARSYEILTRIAIWLLRRQAAAAGSRGSVRAGDLSHDDLGFAHIPIFFAGEVHRVAHYGAQAGHGSRD